MRPESALAFAAAGSDCDEPPRESEGEVGDGEAECGAGDEDAEE